MSWVDNHNLQYDLIAHSSDKMIVQLVPSPTMDFDTVFNLFCLRFYFVQTHLTPHAGYKRKTIIASNRITAIKAFFKGSANGSVARTRK